jgi:hypothetical protein
MSVVEPILTTVKLAPASNIDSARTVTYQVEIRHDTTSAIISTSDAYDIRVEDILSNHSMSYVPGSFMHVS